MLLRAKFKEAKPELVYNIVIALGDTFGYILLFTSFFFIIFQGTSNLVLVRSDILILYVEDRDSQ